MNLVMQAVARRPEVFIHEPETMEAPGIRTDAVYVVYTSIEDTFAAIKAADGFAKPLGLPVTVVHLKTVPYAVALDTPDGISPIQTDEFRARLQAANLNVQLSVYLCRDERQAIATAFRAHSLVVIAGRAGWWPTRARRIRRVLEQAGQFVVFVDTSKVVAESPVTRDISPMTAVPKEASHA